MGSPFPIWFSHDLRSMTTRQPSPHQPTEISSDQREANHKRVYQDIFEMLPSVENPTPLIRINRLNTSESFTMFAKLEWMNPFGSVKDRAAARMIRALEADQQLSETRGMVEPTSGNTGLSLAALASVKGYPMRAVLPNKVPLTKKLLLKMAGADLQVINDELCPAPGLGDGSINMAKTYAKAQSNRYVMPNQYENENNVAAHEETTGPEIWKQTDGQVTHVFVSLGTCGTVTGLAKYLKNLNPAIKVIAVQPSEGHDVPGLRNVGQLEVSKLFNPDLIDEILEVDFRLAYENSIKLFRNEGLRAGPSSGLIFEGARQTAANGASGTGVMIFCDDLFKYTDNYVRHFPELLEGTEP